MLIYNWEKMRLERVNDTNPDMLAEKLDDDFSYDVADDYDDGFEF